MRPRASVPLLAMAFLLSAVSAASAGESVVPAGIRSNCEKGDFGENSHVALEAVFVEPWLDNRADGEQVVVAVALVFDKEAGGDPEKIETAFMVTDAKFEKRYSPVLGGAVRNTGTFAFNWDLRDPDGNRVEDGVYKVVMNITGERYGDLLRNAVFPLYVTSGPPAVSDQTISTKRATLEYDGAPGIGFTSTGVGVCAVVDYDADGEEVGRWEGVMGPGKHSLKSDLTDEDGDPLAPGKYTTRIVMQNKFGTSDELAYEYELVAPPELDVAVKRDGADSVQVDDETVIYFTATLNQNAYLTVEHVAENGKTDLIGKSTVGKPAVLYPKGSHRIEWHRVDMDELERYTTGTHWLRVTASAFSGEEKTAESERVTLTPAPKPQPKPQPKPTPQKQEQKRTIPNVSLELDPDHIIIGGRMLVKIKYRFDQDSMIKVTIFDKTGKTVKKVVDSRNEHIKKGSYSITLDAENFDYGNYKVVFEATNFYGTKKTSETMSVTWR